MLFLACNRNQVTWDGEITSTLDNSFADSEFSAIRNMVDTEGRADTAVFGKVSGTTGIYCPGSTLTVTVTSPTTANLVIDFGSGSNCLDGRLRTGKIRAAFNGKWKDSGTRVTITPESYTVAGYAFAFTEVVTFNGRDGAGHLNWTSAVSNAVMINPSNGTINWSGTRTTTWIEGEGNSDPRTFVYEVTGYSDGVSRSGLNFSATIDQPLRVELDCAHVVDGIWSITPQGLETRTLDYVGPSCDNQGTLTVGSFTTAVTLP